jgi:zinc D-Ala-D-Ala carboxypeptidase
MRLTDHFTLDELLHSDDAAKYGIDNVPSSVVAANLRVLAVGLESVRTLLGSKPISISSGYRCPQLNRIEHGANDSAHLSGYAADFTCAAFGNPITIVRFLELSGLKYDQLIQEGTWVHISFAPAMRQQTLTAHFDAAHHASYTTGA